MNRKVFYRSPQIARRGKGPVVLACLFRRRQHRAGSVSAQNCHSVSIHSVNDERWLRAYYCKQRARRPQIYLVHWVFK